MFTVLIVIHIFVAISLVLVVLLQTGKGAELGAAFGGMGQTTSGRGKSTFISKFTTGLAIVFMSTSLSLAFLTTEHPQNSLLKDGVAPSAKTAPANNAAPKATSSKPVEKGSAKTQPAEKSSTPSK